MKTLIDYFSRGVCFFFVILFIYAAVSKLLDFENFQVQLAQSPLLSAYAGLISYAVILIEIVIAGLLLFKGTKLWGLYSTFALMTAFSMYIYLMLNYSDFVPCSCGGILEKMSWTQHLIFNVVTVFIAGVGIVAMYPIPPDLSLVVESDEEWMDNYNSRRRSRVILAVTIPAVFLLSAGFMVGLFLSSEHIMKKENNFTRRFTHHPILEDKAFDLKVNSYYFVGSNGNDIYLGNLSSPFRIFKMDGQFEKMDTINLVPGTNHQFRNLRYTLQQQILYGYDGSVPVIYASPIDSLQNPLREISSNEVYFDQLVPVSPTQFILRIEENATKKTALATLSLGNTHQVKINSSLLTKKADGGFDADGRLLYDPEMGNAYYLFYYRNQILQLDQHLNLNAEMKTIDTISKAQIQTTVLKDGSKKMSIPPIIVNKEMIVYKGLIFNKSNLIGKHESKELWKNNAVVDIYTTAPAGYWGSMYVQNRGKNKMSQMLMTDEYFYVLSGNEMIRYRSAQTLTEHFINGRSRKPKSE